MEREVTGLLPKYNSSIVATNVIVGSKLYMSQLRGHIRNRNIKLKHNHQLIAIWFIGVFKILIEPGQLLSCEEYAQRD